MSTYTVYVHYQLSKLVGLLQFVVAMSNSMERVSEDKVRCSLDLINSLWSLGAEQDLALPSIAVIGDKNFGKSSVLEALSGVVLPRERNYPLVLKLRKANEADQWCGKVRYQDSEQSDEKIIQQNDYLAEKIKEVQSWYYRSEHFITLEITSPNVPDLTLVDLPRISSVGSNKNTLKKLIRNPETIIMMVLPCDVDITKTEALKMAQEVDPDGERTWGILTKPDLADEAKKKMIVNIVQNKSLSLKKGHNIVTSRLAKEFIVVRCWGQTQMSQMDRINKEKQFFSDHTVFKGLTEDGNATVPKVAERLSQELAQHIEKFLPRLKAEVKRQLLHAYAELKRYSDHLPPCNEADWLTFLNDKITSFTQDLIKLTSGELQERINMKVHSTWAVIVDTSQESFQVNLELEVAQYEQKSAERKLGLSFSTFEHVIKDQIKLLEEPAFLLLKKTAEMVQTELHKQAENSLYGFYFLISDAQSAINRVILESQKAAEMMISTQLKMELCGAQTEGNTKPKTSGKQKSPVAQLHSYYHNACQHLSRQIPLMILFNILQESCSQLQREMLQMYKDNPDINQLLRTDSKISQQRDESQKRLMRLTEAQILLSGF